MLTFHETTPTTLVLRELIDGPSYLEPAAIGCDELTAGEVATLLSVPEFSRMLDAMYSEHTFHG